MKLFHRHSFDPEKWKIVSEVRVGKTMYAAGVATGTLPIGVERVWSNTCKECGDLVFRRAKELEL